MELKPIQKSNRIYQNIIQQVKDSIETGAILPGDKLPSERALAEILNVSRTSVKEAITVLESSGIITVRPGVGMFLNDDSQQNLQFKLSQILNKNETNFTDLIELRQAVEGDAAYYVASRISAKQKEKLKKIYQKLVGAGTRGEVAIEEDYLFHYTLVESANNPVMLEVINLVSDKMKANLEKSREHSIKNEFLNQQVISEHENIYHAVINNQPEAARDAMWQHHQGMEQRHKQIFGNEG